MKSLINLSFENTTDDCLLQQGAGGGYGASKAGGVTVKPYKSSLTPGTKSQGRQKAETNISPFGYGGAKQKGGGSPANDRMTMAKAKAAAAAGGSSGGGSFIGKPASGKGSRKIKTSFAA